MKNSSRKSKTIKITIISLCSLLLLAVILCLSAYLLMHSYISKVNYVPLEEADADQSNLSHELTANGNSPLFKERYASLGRAYLDGREAMAASAAGGFISGQSQTEIYSFGQLAAEDGELTSETEDAEGAPGEEEAREKLEERIRKNIGDSTTKLKQDKEVLNLLLIGTDNRFKDSVGLSDAMIIVSINQKKEKITAASLLRDIYLYIPEKNTFNRLNTAYAKGGARLLIKTIEENFKIKIDKYASVDFFSFIDLIDALGGVEINITEEELPYVNGLIKELNSIQGKEPGTDYLKIAGEQLLNGRQALGYSRVRYVGTDFGRTARQRMILEQIFNKFKKLGAGKITELLDLLLPQVTTNFTEKEIITQLLSLPDYMEYNYDAFSIPLAGTYENLRIRGMQVLGIDFEKNVRELQKRLYPSD